MQRAFEGHPDDLGILFLRSYGAAIAFAEVLGQKYGNTFIREADGRPQIREMAEVRGHEP